MRCFPTHDHSSPRPCPIRHVARPHRNGLPTRGPHPAGYFLTKIFHPNVSASGEICVNTLKRDWSPQHGLRHILTVIRCLMVEPNPESALNEEAGRLLLEGFPEFAKKAALYTGIHAKRCVRPQRGMRASVCGGEEGGWCLHSSGPSPPSGSALGKGSFTATSFFFYGEEADSAGNAPKRGESGCCDAACRAGSIEAQRFML